ncbi:molybdenum ABC transporter substrate-binding protein [Streptantibioticus rubrisoli]|uniref:Molybdenum ABC transporter substrate-binding protein n=1 Tax=Streptantibioticus rubrisoli TaxID=1387313 RepID=A0ABT1P678_9ACTN|nr:molybdenum ABC transporter substrate-binding protein [Streptantibioticus rubrisoli]MCQ4040881.1 molybdenum ABC transporter substrate-binding protein [Streptantibioticus rubrisoli]
MIRPHRAFAALVLVTATVALAGCGGESGPSSRAEVCRSFDKLGDRMLAANGVFDDPLFHQTGDLAGLTSRYPGPPDLSADAARLHRIAGSNSTTGADLLAATEHIADLCGHPLGLGGTL